MLEENKVIDYSFEGSNLTIKVDPNKDGQPVISLTISLTEVADEILSALKPKA